MPDEDWNPQRDIVRKAFRDAKRRGCRIFYWAGEELKSMSFRFNAKTNEVLTPDGWLTAIAIQDGAVILISAKGDGGGKIFSLVPAWPYDKESEDMPPRTGIAPHFAFSEGVNQIPPWADNAIGKSSEDQ